MQHFIQKLQQQEREYDKIIKHAEEFLSKVSEGRLDIIHNKNTEQYYHRIGSVQSEGKYLKKSEIKLIQELAQKSYEKKMLHMARKNRKCIQQFLAQYKVDGITTIYEGLPGERQKLIQPYILPQEEFVKNWQQQTYRKKEVVIQEDSNGIYSEKGELVRSKSEKILADKLHTMDIPYHYEKPLYLKGYGWIYPDFHALNVRTREEFYWEHLGMMDNPEYCEKAIKKIECYEKNHIFPGESLIITYETKEHPINIKIIEQMVKQYLL